MSTCRDIRAIAPGAVSASPAMLPAATLMSVVSIAAVSITGVSIPGALLLISP